ncbi:MAG: hypothetical protein ACW99J_01740 [Candidatus Thorarchaeota archaeon]|jgi:hypothetical protein
MKWDLSDSPNRTSRRAFLILEKGIGDQKTVKTMKEYERFNNEKPLAKWIAIEEKMEINDSTNSDRPYFKPEDEGPSGDLD